MAAREYVCTLLYYGKQGMFSSEEWREKEEQVTFEINLASAPSMMNALIGAIIHFGGDPDAVERYRLALQDDDGDVFTALEATSEQLQWHRDGYPTNIYDRAAPPALASFSDQDLLAELQRRLAEHWADPSSVSTE